MREVLIKVLSLVLQWLLVDSIFYIVQYFYLVYFHIIIAILNINTTINLVLSNYSRDKIEAPIAGHIGKKYTRSNNSDTFNPAKLNEMQSKLRVSNMIPVQLCLC